MPSSDHLIWIDLEMTGLKPDTDVIIEIATVVTDKNLNAYQTYKLVRIKHGKTKVIVRKKRVAPSNIGKASMPNYAALRNQAVTSPAKGVKSFVGQAEDSFFLDLRVFDLLYGGDLSEAGDDTLAGFNVNTMALQVPKARVRGDEDGIIGVWNTASRRSTRVQTNAGTVSHSGDLVQVSRLGMPLVMWAYPRWRAINARGGKGTLYAQDYAARVAEELGADLVKLHEPEEDNERCPEPYRSLKEAAPERLRRVVRSAGRVMVLFSGGVKQDDDQAVLRKVKLYMDSGATGVMFGRNMWLRSFDHAVALTRQVHPILRRYSR